MHRWLVGNEHVEWLAARDDVVTQDVGAELAIHTPERLHRRVRRRKDCILTTSEGRRDSRLLQGFMEGAEAVVAFDIRLL